jgi:hypothetical protein
MTIGLRRAGALTLLTACLLAATSCSEVVEPVVTMTGVDLHGISTEGLSFKLLLDNTEVATGLQDDIVTVAAGSTVEIGIPFTILWSGMDKGLTKLLDGEEHDWRFKGSVRLSNGVLSRVFKFSEGGTYDAPKASDIEIDF